MISRLDFKISSFVASSFAGLIAGPNKLFEAGIERFLIISDTLLLSAKGGSCGVAPSVTGAGEASGRDSDVATPNWWNEIHSYYNLLPPKTKS